MSASRAASGRSTRLSDQAAQHHRFSADDNHHDNILSTHTAAAAAAAAERAIILLRGATELRLPATPHLNTLYAAASDHQPMRVSAP